MHAFDLFFYRQTPERSGVQMQPSSVNLIKTSATDGLGSIASHLVQTEMEMAASCCWILFYWDSKASQTGSED